MTKNMKTLTNKGFTLIEAIFSLFIISISMSLLIQVFPILKNCSNDGLNIDFEIGIKQLQELILLGTDFIFEDDEIRFYYMGKDVFLKIDENRIVRTDGYIIYLDDVENAYFSKKGSCFYLNYENKQRFLGCE